ncbi:MAG TPA: hypothetical protein PKA41_02390 [Verrucomicrobiota bacterium]|nr:hypothetical protein [Verrucomicrobiota bacterium]
MPLTAFQIEVLSILARNRSEESHSGGGVVLNAADDSTRFSRDFAIFHEPAGVAFVNATGKPGWIGDDPTLRPHAPSVRGCWAVVRGSEF